MNNLNSCDTCGEKQISAKLFIKEMKKARLSCIIKNLVLIALFAIACIFASKYILFSIAFIIAFVFIRKFVLIGSKVTHEYYNTISRSFEMGDLGFAGFLVGLVAFYAVCSGINWLNENLFPPYFFIFELLVVVAIGLWLFSPLLVDFYFIIESSGYIKNPPKEEYFVLSDYLKTDKISTFKKTTTKAVTGLCITLIVGAFVIQTVQYFVMSPKLLAELNRQEVYTEYVKGNLVINVPQEEFENPDKREYKRFKAKCIDTYVFESDNGGLKTKNTVKVTYNHDGSWIVTDYEANTEVISVDMSGTWTGVGRDGYFIYDECNFTVVIDKMTDTKAKGSIKSVCPQDGENKEYYAGFTAMVEKKAYTDKYGKEQIYYIMDAKTEEHRDFVTDKIVFEYHVETDTLTVSHNYEAVLSREN